MNNADGLKGEPHPCCQPEIFEGKEREGIMACITKRGGRNVMDCSDQHGKRYRKTLPLGTSKDQARTELREIETKIERRIFLHEKGPRFFLKSKRIGFRTRKRGAVKQPWT